MAWVYLVSWYILGTVSLAYVALVERPDRWQEMAWLLVLSGLFSSRKIRLGGPLSRAGGERVAQLSVGSTITFASLFILGTSSAVLVDGFGTLCESFYPSRKRWYVVLFNVLSLCAITLAAGVVYEALGGNIGRDWLYVDISRFETAKLHAVLCALLTYFFLNTLSVAIIVGIVNQRSVLATWMDNSLWSLPCFVAAGSIAAVFSIAYAHAAALAFLVLPVVAVVVLAHDFYQGRLEEQAKRVAELDEKNRELQKLYSSLEQSQHRLRESEARYRAVVEDQMELICRSLPDGTLSFVNEACCRFFGKSSGELLGRPAYVLFGEEEALRRQRLVKALSRNTPSVSRQQRVETPSGEVHWLQWTDRAIFNEDGVLVEVQSVGRDVTEQVVLEEQLRHAQKMEAVGRLAGGVAHDFNNLLMAMSGFSELLLKSKRLDQQLVRYVEGIKEAADRAASLTRQLLAFSRKQVMEPKVLDLNASVAGIEKMLRRLIGEHIALETKLAPDLWMVKVDPTQIDQVIMNLAVNARDAMPDGGKLVIETANVYLDESFAKKHPEVLPGPYVMLAVHDTGCGMDSETLSHIFEPFFTTKPLGKGTGLGLSTVYGIVRQSGGEIEVESELGKGTTFRIYLPRVDAEVSEEEKKPEWDDLPGGNETVLVVEDEEMVRELVGGILESSGYKVIKAKTPREAISIVRNSTERADLLITDVVMPEMTGTELASTLAQEIPGMKVLYMSGHSGDPLIEVELNSGRDVFLQKPFGRDVLIRKVREILDSRQSEASNS